MGKGWGIARSVLQHLNSCRILHAALSPYFLSGSFGWALSDHAFLHCGALNGDMRLLCKATTPRTTTEPPQPGCQGLGDQHIWLVTAIFCSTQAPVLGEDVPPLEAFPEQKSGWPVPVWVAAHSESEVGQQISRSLCQLWHFCTSVVYSSLVPAKADPAVKPALILTALPAGPWSAWVSAVFLVSTQVSASY